MLLVLLGSPSNYMQQLPGALLSVAGYCLLEWAGLAGLHSHKGQIAETVPTLPIAARLVPDHAKASG